MCSSSSVSGRRSSWETATCTEKCSSPLHAPEEKQAAQCCCWGWEGWGWSSDAPSSQLSHREKTTPASPSFPLAVGWCGKSHPWHRSSWWAHRRQPVLTRCALPWLNFYVLLCVFPGGVFTELRLELNNMPLRETNLSQDFFWVVGP